MLRENVMPCRLLRTNQEARRSGLSLFCRSPGARARECAGDRVMNEKRRRVAIRTELATEMDALVGRRNRNAFATEIVVLN